MMGYATVRIEGRLVKDPELRYAPDGTPWLTLSVKVSRANGYGRATTFLECKQSGAAAEQAATEFRQGDVVRIEGSLAQRKWRHGAQDFSKLFIDVASMERAA